MVWEDRDIPQLVASNCTVEGLAVQSEVLETEDAESAMQKDATVVFADAGE